LRASISQLPGQIQIQRRRITTDKSNLKDYSVTAGNCEHPKTLNKVVEPSVSKTDLGLIPLHEKKAEEL
jgi:hypothetical protein